jgi:hypothetical protein
VLGQEGPAAISRSARSSSGRLGMALNVGEVAPDFKLPCAIGNQAGEFNLASQRGRNVVVVFYPLDFTPV